MRRVVLIQWTTDLDQITRYGATMADPFCPFAREIHGTQRHLPCHHPFADRADIPSPFPLGLAVMALPTAFTSGQRQRIGASLSHEILQHERSYRLGQAGIMAQMPHYTVEVPVPPGLWHRTYVRPGVGVGEGAQVWTSRNLSWNEPRRDLVWPSEPTPHARTTGATDAWTRHGELLGHVDGLAFHDPLTGEPIRHYPPYGTMFTARYRDPIGALPSQVRSLDIAMRLPPTGGGPSPEQLRDGRRGLPATRREESDAGDAHLDQSPEELWLEDRQGPEATRGTEANYATYAYWREHPEEPGYAEYRATPREPETGGLGDGARGSREYPPPTEHHATQDVPHDRRQRHDTTDPTGDRSAVSHRRRDTSRDANPVWVGRDADGYPCADFDARDDFSRTRVDRDQRPRQDQGQQQGRRDDAREPRSNRAAPNPPGRRPRHARGPGPSR
jgi:hypothetical protein